MKEVNEELEGSNPIWCSDCGEWIEELCEHQAEVDPKNCEHELGLYVICKKCGAWPPELA